MQNILTKHKNQLVYVLDINGLPLMPTKRFKKVRQLREKKLAKVVSYDPFTIQMLYDVGKEKQELTIGIDSGTSHIGASVVNGKGNDLFSATFNTNTLAIKKGMEDRANHRKTRRRFKRAKQKRRAFANGTAFEGTRFFLASGAETETPYKVIASKLCRLDKNVDNGKLSNTVRHCLDNHINIVNKIKRFLPIDTINVEYAEFDTHRLVNPTISGVDYQKGALYNELNHKAFALNRDKHQCILCSKKTGSLQVHHVIYRSNGGADHYNNLVTLHSECHKKVHSDEKTEKKLFKVIEKKGILNNQVVTRPSTILNSAMSRFVSHLEKNNENVNITYGFETKAKRYEYGIEKTHNNDAYLVALGENAPSKRIEHIVYEQFSRNSRKYIYATKQRKYASKIDGKWKTVCNNRKKAMEQKNDSLFEYRNKYGQKSVSKLKATKGFQPFVDRTNYQFDAGDLVSLEGKFCVISGNSNGGTYVRIKGQGVKNFKPKDLILIEKSKGFRRTNW